MSAILLRAALERTLELYPRLGRAGARDHPQARPPELTAKVLGGIMQFAQKFFEASGLKLSSANELPYSLVFRFAVCAYLHALYIGLHWAGAQGGKQKESAMIW